MPTNYPGVPVANVIDKVVSSAAAAVADIPDGASVAVVGFGIKRRFPTLLVTALSEQGAKYLTLVCNSPGGGAPGTAQDLIVGRQVSKLITCFSARPGPQSPAEAQIAEGSLELELVPQGTLVERLRAGGAGIPAFYTRSGVGTVVADGKETQVFDGEEYLLEMALPVDYALIHAWRGDAAGNLQFRGGSRGFNVSFAKGAKVTIAEVEEIVEIGEIEPNDVHLPGIFVTRIVQIPPVEPITAPVVAAATSTATARKPREGAREYNGKPALTRGQMARVAAGLLPASGYVNLGIGLPTMISSFLDADGVVLHAENGILGYGEQISSEDADPDVYNAGSESVSLRPGASFFDSVTSFEIARSKRLDAVVLGAYQVDSQGNLANYATPGMLGGGIGGGMDLAVGGKQLIILTEHQGKGGVAKLVSECTYPLTGTECVDVVVTDLAILRRCEDQFVLEAVAPGFSPEEVLSLTEMSVTVPDNVAVIAVNE